MHDYVECNLFRIVTFEVFKGTGYSGCIGETYDDIQVSMAL